MKKNIVYSVYGMVILLLFVGCKFNNSSNAQDSPEERLPVRVIVHPVERSDMSRLVTTKGTFYPVSKAVISPKVPGKIMTIDVEEGDNVKKGEILIRMDDTQVSLDLQREEATLSELKARLEASRMDVENANARIAAAEAVVSRNKAERDLKQLEKERVERLVHKRSMTQQKYDYAKSALDIAMASVESSEAELASSKAGLKEAEASLKTTQASIAKEEKLLAIARQRLEDTRITSPIDGVITAKLMNFGEMSDPGKPILMVEKIDLLELKARVSSEYIQQMRAGLSVTVYPDGFKDPLTASITRVNPVIDPMDRTMEIVCRIANPEQVLKPGLFARLEIIAEVFQQAVVVPTSSIVQRDKQHVVFIAENERAKPIPVVSGYETEGRSIILKGLQGNELLIVEGQKDLLGNELLQIDRKG